MPRGVPAADVALLVELLDGVVQRFVDEAIGVDVIAPVAGDYFLQAFFKVLGIGIDLLKQHRPLVDPGPDSNIFRQAGVFQPERAIRDPDWLKMRFDDDGMNGESSTARMRNASATR